MGQRMFVAVRPPEDVVDELSEFLEARPGMPWIAPQQWHLTLAFVESVPEHRIDELAEELATHLAKVAAFHMALAGAGAFPDRSRAKVLWLGVTEAGRVGSPSLESLSRTARGVANSVGATPDGRTFVPHLTLARLRRPVEATKWLRTLDTIRTGEWTVREVELVASHVGHGHRPRHEVLASLPLALP